MQMMLKVLKPFFKTFFFFFKLIHVYKSGGCWKQKNCFRVVPP